MCDVSDDLGPPSFVPLAATADLPVLPNWYPPVDSPVDSPDHDDTGWTASVGSPTLYEHERSGAGSVGTVVGYSTSPFHRGRQLTRPRGARYTIHVNFRPTHLEWAARRSWVDESIKPGWAEFVGRATPDQLALFGVPRPGHRYWTQQTLDDVAQRYPLLDTTPWRNELSRPDSTTQIRE